MHTISDRKLLMLKPSQIRILNTRIRKNIDTEKLRKLIENLQSYATDSSVADELYVQLI